MRVEVLNGPERRRRWSSEERARIVGEAEQVGVTVADVARRHGVSRSQIYTWRREGRPGLTGRDETAVQAEFVPVVVEEARREAGSAGGKPVARSGRLTRHDGAIEIVLPGDVRVVVRCGVEERALRTVLGVLRSA